MFPGTFDSADSDNSLISFFNFSSEVSALDESDCSLFFSSSGIPVNPSSKLQNLIVFHELRLVLFLFDALAPLPSTHADPLIFAFS